MKILSLIAAMSKNRVIGLNNQLPWDIPEDMKYFKDTTFGKPVIMGRKTYESMGRALPKRPNFVVSRNPEYALSHAKDATVTQTLEAAIELAVPLNDEVFVIGGGELYRKALETGNVDRIYLTVIDREYEGDAFFPKFSLDDFVLKSSRKSEASDEAGKSLAYDFRIYERVGRG